MDVAARSDFGAASARLPPRAAIASAEKSRAAIAEADRKMCDMQAKLSMHFSRPLPDESRFSGPRRPQGRPITIGFQDEPGMKMAALLRPSV
jgi:hypothetical protein